MPLNSEKSQSINFRVWLLNVISWDGILPLVMIGVSVAIKWMFPNHQRIVEYSLLFLAVTAFLIRLCIGLTQIRANHCGEWTKRVQLVVFLLSIMLFALLEFILMLVPSDQWFANKADNIIWAILFSIYFAGMVFSWYPGRSKSPQ